MSKGAKAATGAVVVAVILLWLLPLWAAVAIIIGVPVAGFLLLDPEQRRRLRGSFRKEIGR
ncbi:hypothetical protein [Streptomyces sp. SAJ15]|uniref:hypothetical protein n=1 Tax=Streptomyces sp. SAJ15 TaxID=2011095 RepID=UPI001184DE7A|nr:hypothetical protein [Streptomyces sp. SAJ15]TVL89587.1 hypothetical protein CD790_27335 [Streptomyces sp. SAJ15]